MPKQSEAVRKQAEQHARIHDEATKALLDAEDALSDVEDRESRRSGRNRTGRIPNRDGL